MIGMLSNVYTAAAHSKISSNKSHGSLLLEENISAILMLVFMRMQVKLVPVGV
jgi:hypothetical protein